MAKFVVRSGPHAGLEIEMPQGRLLFGRSEECDVVLADPDVSRNHAQALDLDGSIILYDLNSSNGTFVNGVPISRTYLMDGDEVRIGGTVFRFVATPDAQAGSTVPPAAEQSSRLVGAVPSAAEASEANNTRLLRCSGPEVSADTLKELYLRLKALYRISLEISQSRTLRDMVEAVGQASVVALGVQRLLCFVRNDASGSWEPFYTRLASAVQTRAGDLPAVPTELIERVAGGAEPAVFDWRDGGTLAPADGLGQAVALTIFRHNEPYAVLFADNPLSRVTFTKDDLDFLATLARQIVVRMQQIDQVELLRVENLTLRQRYGEDYAIVTQDEKMKSVMELTRRAAERDCTVLITGETGTGKELIARSLHNFSPRRTKRFVAVNCAALPDTLLESELFGHEKGAFTGATERRIGKFEEADGGTLVLDEIGDISPNAQAKLLRVLQEGEIQRLGSNRIIKVNVRVVAVTNKKLEEEVKSGRFRLDLYYRIRVVEIALPPLRERPADIPVLAQYFLEQLRRARPTPVRYIHSATIACLCAYSFPGNVRELRNIIERALVFATGDTLLPEHLPAEVIAAAGNKRPDVGSEAGAQPSPPGEFVPRLLSEIEREHIQRVLEHVQGNKVKAASLLGISRTTLYEKLKEYGLAQVENKGREEPSGRADD
jgi:Nif-specific regulatory protein